MRGDGKTRHDGPVVAGFEDCAVARRATSYRHSRRTTNSTAATVTARASTDAKALCWPRGGCSWRRLPDLVRGEGSRAVAAFTLWVLCALAASDGGCSTGAPTRPASLVHNVLGRSGRDEEALRLVDVPASLKPGR